MSCDHITMSCDYLCFYFCDNFVLCTHCWEREVSRIIVQIHKVHEWLTTSNLYTSTVAYGQKTLRLLVLWPSLSEGVVLLADQFVALLTQPDDLQMGGSGTQSLTSASLVLL